MGTPFTLSPHRIFLSLSSGLTELYWVQIGFIAYVAYDVQCFNAGAGVHQWNIPVTEIGASAKASRMKPSTYIVPILIETRSR